MKLTKKQLSQVINEELARGIPDYAFTRPVENAVDLLISSLIDCLKLHINQTAKDPFIRNKKYAAANKIAASLRNDREFVKTLEEKLKQKLIIFLDEF